MERGDTCVPGAIIHDHPGEPGVSQKVKDKLAIHAQKKANPYKSTATITVSKLYYIKYQFEIPCVGAFEVHLRFKNCLFFFSGRGDAS